ncbi:hypothetical protein BRADI_3g05247v3 [Brachypodium distachyon]|uniref:Uncharacterized protein n=2 Tax=Brachypodium distachyon TaxID=15368 RepID=A0A2K2CVC3_BRADI|nr:hypothetical protein BRADI_3g05247v3 [Brachypodium distachyon]
MLKIIWWRLHRCSTRYFFRVLHKLLINLTMGRTTLLLHKQALQRTLLGHPLLRLADSDGGGSFLVGRNATNGLKLRSLNATNGLEHTFSRLNRRPGSPQPNLRAKAVLRSASFRWSFPSPVGGGLVPPAATMGGGEGKSRKRRSSASSGEGEERGRKKRRDKKENRRSSRDGRGSDEEEEKRRRKKKKHGDKGKDKERDSKERRSKEKEKSKQKDKDAAFKEISKDDYFAKSNEFATWLKEEKGKYFSDLSSESARDMFVKFVKEWNKGKLPSQYYEGITTGPRTAHNWNIKV